MLITGCTVSADVAGTLPRVWEILTKIEPIIEEELTNQGVEVTVYDFKKG